ncbi:MAG: alpha/beta hydrolase [Comamonadaceae bacterium]|nr:MAG: alpha/beta hydrolase [Comamonadaceae bacterium]
MHEQDRAVTTWVLLRGLTRESGHWGGFASTLQSAVTAVTAAHAGRRARVIMLDLPGNGALNGLRSPASVPGMVAACRSQLRDAGVAGPVHLLAMSLGAMVAAHWSHVAPDEVAGCVLINTSFRPFSPFYQRLRPRNYATLLGALLPGQAPLALERRIWAMTSNHRDMTAAVLPQWAALRQERPVSAGNALRQLVAAATFRAPRTSSAVPMLLLSSACDRLVSARCSDAIAQAWGCAHARHATAGHDLPLDAPQWVAQQVCEWLAARRGAAPAP